MPSKMGHKIICISIGNSQNNVLNKIIEKQTMTSKVNSKENNNDNSQVSLFLNKVYFTAMPSLAFYSNQWLFICYKLIYIFHMLMTDCIFLIHLSIYYIYDHSWVYIQAISYNIQFGLMSHRQMKCADKTRSGLSTYRLDYNYGMKLPDKTISIDQIQSAQNNFKKYIKAIYTH